jgi:hypothetical protein
VPAPGRQGRGRANPAVTRRPTASNQSLTTLDSTRRHNLKINKE